MGGNYIFKCKNKGSIGKHETLRNISNGASKTASTSAGLGVGLNSFLLVSIPITGITLRRCCINNKNITNGTI